MHLYEALAGNVKEWREAGYTSEEFPAIAEVLEWASEPDGSGFRLRPPQIAALETYWYLRLVSKTPHIVDLYKSFFTSTSNLLEALDLDQP